MPIYDYRCQACRRTSSFFVRTVTSPLEPVCQHCGSADVRRAVTTFAYHRSEQARRDAAGEPNNPASGYYEDPRNVGRWVEDQWSRTMGDEPVPGEIHEMIETARGGDLPKPMAGLPDFPDPLGGLDA